LLEHAGVEPEQRVLAPPDGLEFVAALFGTLKVGAVVVMVNPQLTVDGIEYFTYTRAMWSWCTPHGVGVSGGLWRGRQAPRGSS
jgi:acyl-CoA synthetase (AMP-forming)/AMP-acid ligase II